MDIQHPPGIYSPVGMALSDSGTVRWSAQAVASGSWGISEGDCALDTEIAYAGGGARTVGFTCNGPGAAFVLTTGQLTSTCPGDGAALQYTTLYLWLDGALAYSEPLAVIDPPVICYVSPPPAAVVTFVNGVLTFDNSAHSRASAYASYVTSDPAWTYAQHSFAVPPGVGCQARRHKRNNWSFVYITDPGFICSTASVPAGAVLQVTVH